MQGPNWGWGERGRLGNIGQEDFVLILKSMGSIKGFETKEQIHVFSCSVWLRGGKHPERSRPGSHGTLSASHRGTWCVPDKGEEGPVEGKFGKQCQQSFMISWVYEGEKVNPGFWLVC